MRAGPSLRLSQTNEVNSTFETQWLISRLGPFLDRNPTIVHDLTSSYRPTISEAEREQGHLVRPSARATPATDRLVGWLRHQPATHTTPTPT